MKNAIQKVVGGVMLVLMTFLCNVYALAQEEAAKVNVTTTETNSTTWYSNPWVWIVGVAIFILLFAAIVRGNRSDA